MRSIHMLVIIMIMLSIGIMKCSDDEADESEPVITTPEESNWISVTSTNFYQYFYFDIRLPSKLENGYYPIGYPYSIQAKARPGVIVESEVFIKFDVIINCTHIHASTLQESTQEEREDDIVRDYFDMSVGYHKSLSEIVNKGHAPNISQNGWYIKSCNNQIDDLQAGHGFVTLDPNYIAPTINQFNNFMIRARKDAILYLLQNKGGYTI